MRKRERTRLPAVVREAAPSYLLNSSSPLPRSRKRRSPSLAEAAVSGNQQTRSHLCDSRQYRSRQRDRPACDQSEPRDAELVLSDYASIRVCPAQGHFMASVPESFGVACCHLRAHVAVISRDGGRALVHQARAPASLRRSALRRRICRRRVLAGPKVSTGCRCAREIDRGTRLRSELVGYYRMLTVISFPLECPPSWPPALLLRSPRRATARRNASLPALGATLAKPAGPIPSLHCP